MAEQEWRAEWAIIVSYARLWERLALETTSTLPSLPFSIGWTTVKAVDAALKEAEGERDDLRRRLRG